MIRCLSPLAAVTVWLAVAAVLLQPLGAVGCECDCHAAVEASTCCHSHPAESDSTSCGAREGDHAAPTPLAPIECANCGAVHSTPVFVGSRNVVRLDQFESAHLPALVATYSLTPRSSGHAAHSARQQTDVASSAAASCALFCRFTI